MLHLLNAATPPRLGDLLVLKGYITAEQLAAALVESRECRERLGQTLVRQGLVFESDLARTLSEQWGIPYVNISLIGVDGGAVRLLPHEVGIEHAAVPVRFLTGGSAVQVAFADPSDEESVAAVKEHIPFVETAVAEYSDIAAAWRSTAA